ncbi:MAG: multidrug effflux MFS transporter [Betaproteobacteria bacterium]|nr:multidrug effflux MFS transporter [Betaproteobacteria bacterium]MDH3436415.1 multidrug effflux MFS transporter [Betaproteobacteria bacterium]
MSTASRPSAFLPLLIAGLATIGPFSIDTYLPSFPAMADALDTTPLLVQQTLTAYLLPYAGMMLFHGAVSDSFGRRRPILAGVAGFALASVGCALAPSIGMLLFFRALQGLLAGVGMVLGRAIIRDCYHGHEAQRLMSQVLMIFAIAPAVAPIIGGWLHTWFGWRANFWFLAGLGVVLFLACLRYLPETHPPHARHPFASAPLIAAYRHVAFNRRFLLLAGAAAINFAGFFIYILSAPAFIYRHLGLEIHQFAWLFMAGVVGMVIGAYLSGRLAGRISPQRAVKLGYTIMFGAALYNVLYCVWFPPLLPWSIIHQAVYAVGLTITMPAITLLLLDLFPRNRGMASSLQGFVHSLFSAVNAGVISPLLSGTAAMLAGGTLGLLAAGFGFWWIYASLPPAPVAAGQSVASD